MTGPLDWRYAENPLTFSLGRAIFPLTKAQAAVSAAKKAVPGFAPCPIEWRLKPRLFRVVFLFSQPIYVGLRLWVRAFGAASAGRFHSGGSANLVRPAHHICTLVGRVHSNRMEAKQ